MVPAEAQKEGVLMQRLLISYTRELRNYSSRTIGALKSLRFIDRESQDMWKQACLRALKTIQEKYEEFSVKTSELKTAVSQLIRKIDKKLDLIDKPKLEALQ